MFLRAFSSLTKKLVWTWNLPKGEVGRSLNSAGVVPFIKASLRSRYALKNSVALVATYLVFSASSASNNAVDLATDIFPTSHE